jgi:ureidoacrylate peracid hydrolase
MAKKNTLAERAKAANYTPPPYKFNPDLNKEEGGRDITPLLMDPESTALIVIDVQNLFTDPEAPLGAPDGPEIIPHINKLVAACRKQNIPIIWVQETNRADGSDLGMMGKYWAGLSPPDGWLFPNTHLWELYPELDNKPEDIYVTKTKYNAFWGSDLEAVLRGLGVESIIFTGICTDVCVGTTLIDAFHRDFNPIMAYDGTTTFTPFKQEWLTRTELLWGRTLTTEEVIAELEALAPK